MNPHVYILILNWNGKTLLKHCLDSVLGIDYYNYTILVIDNNSMENVDIGGPPMIRSAAKNMGWVGVAVNPKDYSIITNELNTNGALSFDTRKILSSKAFGHTAQYDTIIHNYLKDDLIYKIQLTRIL